MKNKPVILVVDDEFGVLQSFKMVLKDDFNVLLAKTGTEALEIYNTQDIDLILLDILLPDQNGLDLLEKFKEWDSSIEVIMITAVKDIQSAVKAIRLGAYDYIVKPFDVEEVLKTVRRALEKRDLVKKVIYLKNELGRWNGFEEMIGQDAKMKKIFNLISLYSQTDGTVLIQGESGTGKELVARAIHRHSSRKDQPFLVINCAAIPPTLMESEIFGHLRGAFTGASTTVIGKLEIANKGSVFLDDIDSLSTSMQSKLLRVIQEKEFEKIGSRKVFHLDVRFIAASNQDLQQLISRGEFREDLFYRLNVLPLELPPLREKKSDIQFLVHYFLESFAKNSGKPIKQVSPEAMKVLINYSWPGNVRELKNLIERLTTIIRGPIIRHQDVALLTEQARGRLHGRRLKEAVAIFEKGYLTEVLEKLNYDIKEAAKLMDIHRNTLINKMKEYNLIVNMK